MKLIYKPKGAAAEYAYLGLNPYRGCRHGCRYCYMAGIWKRYKIGDFHATAQPVDTPNGLRKRLTREAKKLAGTCERVHLSFSTDPYQKLDQTQKLTRICLEVLREYDIPFQVLTKGVRAWRDFDLYGPHDLFGVTLTNLREDYCIRVEPHAAPPSVRTTSLAAAHDAGIKTWVSLEPVVDIAEAFRVIETTAGYVDLFKIGKVNHVKLDYQPDWQKFAGNVVALCDRLRVKYYLKDSLAKYLDPSAYTNTDWRVIER